jgi:hypothetical protein
MRRRDFLALTPAVLLSRLPANANGRLQVLEEVVPDEVQSTLPPAFPGERVILVLPDRCASDPCLSGPSAPPILYRTPDWPRSLLFPDRPFPPLFELAKRHADRIVWVVPEDSAPLGMPG